MTFRRNILVQAFIIIEFLLSLSKQAKEKLASVKAPNRSVMYLDQEVSDEDVRLPYCDDPSKLLTCASTGNLGPEHEEIR